MTEYRRQIAKSLCYQHNDDKYIALEDYTDEQLDEYITENTGDLGYYIIGETADDIFWLSIDSCIEVLNITSKENPKNSFSIELNDVFNRVFVDDNPNL